MTRNCAESVEFGIVSSIGQAFWTRGSLPDKCEQVLKYYRLSLSGSREVSHNADKKWQEIRTSNHTPLLTLQNAKSFAQRFINGERHRNHGESPQIIQRQAPVQSSNHAELPLQAQDHFHEVSCSLGGGCAQLHVPARHIQRVGQRLSDQPGHGPAHQAAHYRQPALGTKSKLRRSVEENETFQTLESEEGETGVGCHADQCRAEASVERASAVLPQEAFSSAPNGAEAGPMGGGEGEVGAHHVQRVGAHHSGHPGHRAAHELVQVKAHAASEAEANRGLERAGL